MTLQTEKNPEKYDFLGCHEKPLLSKKEHDSTAKVCI